MYEQLGLESLSPLAASAIFGVVLGIAFGIAAQHSRFCLRRAVAGNSKAERASAWALWLTALCTAIAGTQLSVYAGWIDFTGHRYHEAAIPMAAIGIGGLLFGVGMILTRGCASRLTVLAGSGNLRALTVLVVFAIAAHATLKGILAPLRTTLSSLAVNVSLTDGILSSAFIPLIASAAAASVVVVLFSTGSAPRKLLLNGVIIGLLVVIGWVGTGLVLQDDFDPIVFQSLSFTSSSTEWLFWGIASTSIGAGFGVGLLSGVFIGSALSSLSRSEFKWESFESPAQTGRYLSGAVLMGIGGVLAGGCTVGAGLSGVSSLSLSALMALVAIVIGANATHALLSKTVAGSEHSVSGTPTPV